MTDTPATDVAAKPAAKAAAKTTSEPAKKAPRKTAAKPAAKAAVKSAVRPASKKAPTAKPAAPARKSVDKVAPKASRKIKMIRDSFTMPKDEYAAIASLKERGVKLGRPLRKSEILRAGIQALKALNDKALLAAIAALPQVKTGRPKSKNVG